MLPTPLASQPSSDLSRRLGVRVGRDGQGKPRIETEDGQTFSVGLGQMARLGNWPDGARPPGKLNPEYVEWLMGFPEGWTA